MKKACVGNYMHKKKGWVLVRGSKNKLKKEIFMILMFKKTNNVL